MPTYFVSGHLDLTDDEFAAHYKPRISAALASGAAFVIGDAKGCDALTQRLLAQAGCLDVRVFHMFQSPRNNCGFRTVGGFATDAERDAAMTAASDEDIAWIRPGREKSGTAKNLKRRSR